MVKDRAGTQLWKAGPAMPHLYRLIGHLCKVQSDSVHCFWDGLLGGRRHRKERKLVTTYFFVLFRF